MQHTVEECVCLNAIVAESDNVLIVDSISFESTLYFKTGS